MYILRITIRVESRIFVTQRDGTMSELPNVSLPRVVPDKKFPVAILALRYSRPT